MKIGEEVRERAEVLGEELMNVLLELAERERGFEGSGADQTLREALAAISSFRQRKDLDDAAVGELSNARALLDKAAGMIGDEACRDSVREAAEFLDKVRSRSIELMVERDRALTADRPAPAPPVDEFVLSLGTPALVKGVAVAVPRLFPEGSETRLATRSSGREPSEDDEDDDQWELVEPAPEIRARSRNGDEGDRAQIEAMARDAMEDLASFSSLRVLSDNEPWKDGEPFERRLLACVDSLVSLSRPVCRGAAELDLAEALFGFATEWAVPDRGRAFAFALTMCCVDSDAALLWVTMALRRAAHQTLPAYVDALALGSNPTIPSKLLALLSDDVPRELMLVALKASIRRRVFNAGTMIGLAGHPDAEIATLATRCFAFAPGPIAEATLHELALAKRASVRAAAGATMVEASIAQGKQVLRDVIDELVGQHGGALDDMQRGATAAALRGLTINADPKDADRIWAAARALGSYREVGFFGHVGHVPLLYATMDELDRAEPTAQMPVERGVEQLDRVAGAIRRITGIRPPSYGPGRYDLAAFKDLWSKQAPEVQAVAGREGRVRFGKAWSKRAVIEELADASTHQGDRRILADELALASNGKLRFDVDGWIADQRAFLKMVTEAWD